MFGLLKKIFGTANDRIVKKLRKEVDKINAFEPNISKLTDVELQAKTIEFKEKLASGSTEDEILHEAFAVVREASKRVSGMRHFDVQLIGGLVLHSGKITEMRTGEGKTLVATLPAYLNALSGKGIHIVTVNDYLAERDSHWMGKIYKFLGLSVGYLISGMNDEERRHAYACDILYATNNELGFDYLRDNMKFTMESHVQRPLNYAIIDEVDSILIDEARTPLVISGPVDDRSDLYVKIQKIIKYITPEYYTKDEKHKNVTLTDDGISAIEELLIQHGLMLENTGLYDFENMILVHHIQQALRANVLFSKDVDYIVKDGKVMIIDEFTGRVMDGRRFSEGMHQALEAKENVEIQNESQTLASITFQNYFRLYQRLSGMTGTAMTEAAELKDIYNLDVIAVPTNHKVTRIDHDDEIYGSIKEKQEAIARLVKECYEKGQPVLVGTISIEKSEEISRLFTQNNIPHNILNAKFHEKEAHIIAQAGRYKMVTIATNMAGRGTDIQLGGNFKMIAQEERLDEAPEEQKQKKTEAIKQQIEEEKQKVIAAGGLFVIGTERHESRRIDNQLRGRAGRQGDIGETRFFLSLEDDLMRIFASDRMSGILRSLGLKDGEAIKHPMISRSLEKAQQKVETHHYEIRKNLLRYDNVMNDQRKVIYEQRNEIITSESVKDIREAMTENVVEAIVLKYIPKESFFENWEIEGLEKELVALFGIHLDIKQTASSDSNEEDVIAKVNAELTKIFDHKEEQFGPELMKEGEKYVLLATLDQVWKDHLLALDYLRQAINLRAYGQKNPLNEYKKEAFEMFEMMLERLGTNFIQRMCFLQLKKDDAEQVSLKNKKQQVAYEGREDPAFQQYNTGHSIATRLKPTKTRVSSDSRDPEDPSSWGRVSRNEDCPCGSGKKFKHCHGIING
jgi:preprotein translocase subunit SecA